MQPRARFRRGVCRSLPGVVRRIGARVDDVCMPSMSRRVEAGLFEFGFAGREKQNNFFSFALRVTDTPLVTMSWLSTTMQMSLFNVKSGFTGTCELRRCSEADSVRSILARPWLGLFILFNLAHVVSQRLRRGHR